MRDLAIVGGRPLGFGFVRNHIFEKNEIGGACGSYGAGQRGVQGSGGET